MLHQNSDWEFKAELYFLSPGQLPQDPRTSLLIINNTGEQKNKIKSRNKLFLLLNITCTGENKIREKKNMHL
jgi:hypothetical protein